MTDQPITDATETPIEPTDPAKERAAKTARKDAADERIATLEAQLGSMTEQMTAMMAQMQAQMDAQTQRAVEPEPDPYITAQFGDARNQPITMTIRELRKYDGPLYVRHNDNQRQFSCHQALGEHRVDFDLGPGGTPESIGYFPKLALEIRGIQRAIMRGTITVSTDEAMEDEIMLAMGQHLNQTDDQLSALMAPLQPGNNERDVVTKPCLMCGEYTRDPMTNEPSMVIRGGQVFQSYADYKSGKPPLCPKHENQAHLWVGTLVEDHETGIRDWVFDTVMTGATQSGVQTGRPTFQGDERPRVRKVGI